MAVARVDAAPMVDDDVGAEGADDADHVFDDLIAPDFFGFFGSFRVAEIAGAGEVKLDAVTVSRGEKLLCADEAELGSLFGAKSVLAAFAASDGEKSDVRVESASEVGENSGAFVVGVSGDVKDARGDAGGVDGLNSFGKAGAGARSRRELGSCLRGSQGKENSE